MWIFDGDIKRLHKANLSETDTGDVELAGKFHIHEKSDQIWYWFMTGSVHKGIQLYSLG